MICHYPDTIEKFPSIAKSLIEQRSETFSYGNEFGVSTLPHLNSEFNNELMSLKILVATKSHKFVIFNNGRVNRALSIAEPPTNG